MSPSDDDDDDDNASRHDNDWPVAERPTTGPDRGVERSATKGPAPSLFYEHWTHQISEAFPMLRAYRARLLARPSFARAVEEARPFRPIFPLGAPDRD